MGYCANDTTIIVKSDTLIEVDTLTILEDKPFIEIINDTVYVTKWKTNTITKTLTIHDTIKAVVVDGARVKIFQEESKEWERKYKEQKDISTSRFFWDNTNKRLGLNDNTPGGILDIKCSYEAHTFPFFEDEIPTKDYYYQLQGYMWLTGKDEALLCYCLIDTPLQIVRDEIRREHWRRNENQIWSPALCSTSSGLTQ